MVETVYLLRHGHIDNGREKRYLGQTDIPLSAFGVEQAQALRDYFKEVPIHAVFTSPLKRCLVTAQILCEDKNITCQSIEALREINMGDWENVAMSYIKSQYSELYAQRGENLEYFTPPHGESFSDLSKRVQSAFEEIICNVTGPIIIVGHAGVNRMITSYLLGIPINDIFSITQPYACVNKFVRRDKGQWFCTHIL
ncbi:MAG: histidine phosphatase family protein [Sulfurospirillaceae bacterium]|jgi:probable phosphoglycerate mutase|nr:histidine phosphatase family protein [Sulfurospirillaceae bacterium]MDD2826435.1 histidine phosphatase family protein [Sulfurospirillaceae bacterium]